MGVHLCEVASLVFVEPRILSRIGTVPVPGYTRSLKPVRCGGGGVLRVIQTASDKQCDLSFLSNSNRSLSSLNENKQDTTELLLDLFEVVASHFRQTQQCARLCRKNEMSQGQYGVRKCKCKSNLKGENESTHPSCNLREINLEHLKIAKHTL